MTLSKDDRTLLCVGLLVSLAVSGCSGTAGQPPTYPVRGRVLLSGSPVEAADISFVPKVAHLAARPAWGRTDATGEFELRTYVSPTKEVLGAVADEYVVVISKITPPAVVDLALRAPPANHLPPRYASPGTSGLSAAVGANGSNRFEFDLKGR